MSKESFKQFVKRQEEKLDKAEKMIEEVEGRWKDEIEEFEMVEKSVKELKKLWEENEEELGAKGWNETFSFFFSLPLPEISPSLLERISNKFLKEFDWERIEVREYLGPDLSLFLTVFLKKNIENYTSSQKNKGIKEENIEPIEVYLKVKEAPIVLDYLGYRNPEKLHLIIEGNCGRWTGSEMQGGKIIVKGNCGDWIGGEMQGGEMIVEGNCGDLTGEHMQGRVLNVKGEVKSFDKSAFSPNNKDTIIWKNTKIWENGDWTKEGKEMWEKGEIPVG